MYKKKHVTFVNHIFEPLLELNYQLHLSMKDWQTYKDNTLHQSNKNWLIIKWQMDNASKLQLKHTNMKTKDG